MAGCPRLAFAVDCNVLHMIAGVGCDDEFFVFALFHRYGAGRSNAAAFAGRGFDIVEFPADVYSAVGNVELDIFQIIVHSIIHFQSDAEFIPNLRILRNSEVQDGKVAGAVVLVLIINPAQRIGVFIVF